MNLAAIDIGSNSIKLIVVNSAKGKPFSVLSRQKEVVRLGHDTLRDGHIAPGAQERAIETIKRFRAQAESYGATKVLAIATASVREADNGRDFVAEVKKRTSVDVDILSGVEEARLIGLAASTNCAPHYSSILNVDIGGGSTEISLMRGGVAVHLFSVKLGAVGLTDRFISTDPVKFRELSALRAEIRGALGRPSREMRGARWEIASGTSGSILAIGGALHRQKHMRTAGANGVKQINRPGLQIGISQLLSFNERMISLSVSERRQASRMSQQRAEIIIAGGQILEGVMRTFKINHLQTCEWALREGLLIDRLREMEAEYQSPRPDRVEPRLRGVYALAKRFNYEEAHAHTVAGLAEKIFDQLAAIHKLSRHDRMLLSAAAILHDIGYIVSHESHHKHSSYLIKYSELTGFSETEKDVIANIARYHRRTLPRDKHPFYAALSEADREIVWRLGAILRIAEALDKNHEGRVRDLRCTVDGRNINLQLRGTSLTDDETWAVERSREMFELAFDCKMTISHRALARRVS